MWHKLPVKERMSLMQTYRDGGFSYRDAVKDYNDSYQKFGNGGNYSETVNQHKAEDPNEKYSAIRRAANIKDEEKRIRDIGTVRPLSQMPPAQLTREDLQEGIKYGVNIAGAFNPYANVLSSAIDLKDGDYIGAALGAVPFVGQELKAFAPGRRVMTKMFNAGVPFKTAEGVNHAIRGGIESLVGAGKIAGAKNDFYDPLIERGERISKHQYGGMQRFEDGGEQFPQIPLQNYNPSETVQSQAMPYINNVPQVLPVKQVAKPGIDLSKLSKQEQIDYGINKVAEREKPEKRKALETLLRTTSWMENNYGSNPKAYNRGYTNSFMSLDDIALKDMFTGKGDKGAYTKGQLDQLKRLNELGLPKTQDEFKKLLKKDDSVASLAAARMVYGSSPEQLPDPNNPQKVFDYYYKYYNKAGASKYGNREKDYNRFLEGYKKYGPQYKNK